jgi:hypothetical protein
MLLVCRHSEEFVKGQKPRVPELGYKFLTVLLDEIDEDEISLMQLGFSDNFKANFCRISALFVQRNF